MLRHSGLTMIMEATRDIYMVKEIAGHSSLSSTMIYLHLALSHKKQAVELAFKGLNGFKTYSLSDYTATNGTVESPHPLPD